MTEWAFEHRPPESQSITLFTTPTLGKCSVELNINEYNLPTKDTHNCAAMYVFQALVLEVATFCRFKKMHRHSNKIGRNGGKAMKAHPTLPCQECSREDQW